MKPINVFAAFFEPPPKSPCRVQAGAFASDALFHRLRHFAAILGMCGIGGLIPAHANVSVTQGQISGTITFDADFVPDSMAVDAGNPLNEAQRFESHTTATLTTVTPMGGGRIVSAWAYTNDVEASLTSSYYVRPTAYILNPSERAPFPDFGIVTVSPGQTTPFDISYRPVILTGTVAGSDMNGQPLPLRSFFLNAFDTAQDAIQPDCGGSINFCNSASQVQGVLSTYKLYLKPGHSYLLGSQSATFSEPALGSDAYNAIDYNDGEPFTAPSVPGTVVTKDYIFSQKASVSGQLQLNVPPGWQVIGKGVTVSGETLQTLPFYEEFFPATVNPANSYIARLFDFTDFTKVFTLAPLFTVSSGTQGLVEFPSEQINVASGSQAVINFSGDAGVLAGKFTFFPSYRVQNAYPEVQVETTTLGVSQNQFQPDPVNGGSYQLLAFPGTWSYWRFGWIFDLGDTNFTADYIINNFLNLTNATISGLGDTATNNFLFNTALLKVFFTAPDASGLTYPWLDAATQDPTQWLYEHAHGEGLNQNAVLTGEARLVLRVTDTNTPFLISPSAIVNGSRVTFSPFTVTPHAGETIVVGSPANIILSVTSPHPGDTSANCQFAVSGSAGGTQITNISVNGQSTPFVAAPITNDPNHVTFTSNVESGTGSIVVTATDAQGHQVSDTIPIVCLSQPPVIQCPGPIVAECGVNPGNSITVKVAVSDPDLDPVSVRWSVDGVLVATHALPSGATSDSMTTTYTLGAHAVGVVANDGRGGTATCGTTVTIQDTTPPTLSTTVCQAVLWPPDHDLINVGFNAEVKDTCDCAAVSAGKNCSQHNDDDKDSKANCKKPSDGKDDDKKCDSKESDDAAKGNCNIPVSVQVFSDEDDQEDTGTGNFSPDAKNIAPGTLRLRSERKGNGNGRVYLIVTRATDQSGNTAIDCATVVVPHDQSPASIAAIKAKAASAAATVHSTGQPPVGYFVVGDGPIIGPKQ